MIKNYPSLSATLFGVIICMATQNLMGAVDDITGDVGTAQTGSLTLSGGTSGGVFDSTTSTITQSFNFLSLPITTATNGQIIIGEEVLFHNYGPANQNIFVGPAAGNFTTTAAYNTGLGSVALNLVSSGGQNTAIGHATLTVLTEGLGNTAVGDMAGGSLVDGNSNIFLGVSAGSGCTSDESGNIIIGNQGISNESNTIRIGEGQTDCYVSGIYDTTIDFDTGLPVFIDDAGKLGTIISSARFKDNIKDMGNDSTPILNFRPISFSLKSDPKKAKQFGLLAEEVNKVMPELVIKDKKGAPYAVRYFELPVLLLNELQKANTHIVKLEKRLQTMDARIAKLEAQCAC